MTALEATVPFSHRLEVEGAHLGDQRLHLALLDELSDRFEPRSFAREEDAVQRLILVGERRQVAVRSEDGRDAAEPSCRRDGARKDVGAVPELLTENKAISIA